MRWKRSAKTFTPALAAMRFRAAISGPWLMFRLRDLGALAAPLSGDTCFEQLESGFRP